MDRTIKPCVVQRVDQSVDRETNDVTRTAASRRWYHVTTIDVVAPATLAILWFLSLEANSYFHYLFFGKFFLISLVWPAFRRTCYVWFLSAAIMLPSLITEWCNHEDHAYLALYWCLALGLATMPTFAGKPAGKSKVDPEYLMRRSARLLIGLCFLFAVAWKVSSPQYCDSSLFHHKLLSDKRFVETLARFPGGLQRPALVTSQANLESLYAPTSTDESAKLVYTKRFSLLAISMTWWTVFIEGLLAVCFLMPASRRLNLIRNTSLILFCLSTYLIAPVMGFCLTFLTMGFANCERNEKRTRVAYLLSAAAMIFCFIYREEIMAVVG